MSDLVVLNQEYEAELRAFLMRDPLNNLFMIGDLEMFGLGVDTWCTGATFYPVEN